MKFPQFSENAVQKLRKKGKVMIHSLEEMEKNDVFFILVRLKKMGKIREKFKKINTNMEKLRVFLGVGYPTGTRRY